jgi:rod shape-determining protein MreD
MRYCFYIAAGLVLIICQTTLVPRLPFVGSFFDLLLPLVIYLAAFRPLPEALPFVLFLGALVDNLSAGAFGLYLTSYLWLFIGVRLAATVVRADNSIVLVLILIGAVLFQNALFVGALGVSSQGVYSPGHVFAGVSEQIGWVLLTGPFFSVAMRHTKRLEDRRLKKAAALPEAALAEPWRRQPPGRKEANGQP